MEVRSVAILLVLVTGLFIGSVGCGKFGPPVRVHDRPATDAASQPGVDETDEESESQTSP